VPSVAALAVAMAFAPAMAVREVLEGSRLEARWRTPLQAIRQ